MKTMTNILLSFFIFSISSFASDTTIKKYSFQGVNNIEIVYHKFGTQKGKLGSVAISPGRTESSLRYIELANDLIKKGYSPVYITNHRGQGLSGRMLKNTHKGYVRHFGNYTHDFHTFTKILLKDPMVDKENLYLISHSMGGAIALDYLQHYRHPYKKAAFSAPMFKINLDGRSEASALLQLVAGCNIPLVKYCAKYAKGGDYDERNDVFETNHLTHDEERFRIKKQIRLDYPETQLGDATFRWVYESVKKNVTSRTKAKLNNIQIPILVLQAEDENIVDNSGQDEVCKKLENKCELKVIPKAYHGLLLETDDLRDMTLDYIWAFLK